MSTPSGSTREGRPLRVGLYVDFSDGWLGGLNYFKNLVRAARELPDRPLEFVVFTGTRVDPVLLSQWPGAEVVRHALFDRFSPRWVVRKLFQKYLLRDPLLARLLAAHRVDVLSHSGYVGVHSPIPCIGWIPDFQHLHLPGVFRRWDIVRRNAEIDRIVRASTSVVVSSHSAAADLLQVSAAARDKCEVLRFVGEAPGQTDITSKDSLERQYGFDGDFVFLPNQYWRHKNHITVIRALGLLKQQGRSLTVLSTGKTDDFRNPEHFAAVQTEITRLGLESTYRVLGVIPYADVASLMHHCRFAVNPSLFEGWSTTVEEAKALGKHIVLSDIPVHREQAPASADFFSPLDEAELAALLWARWEQLGGRPADHRPDPVAALRAHADKRMGFAQEYASIVRRAVDRKAGG